jgi:phosphopantetheinyl transferase
VSSPVLHLRWCRVGAVSGDPRPAARRWLRLALGRLLELSPESLPLQRLPSGQLQLDGWALTFSHSDAIAVFAAASAEVVDPPRIGVDIESLDRPPPSERACRRVLTGPELDWWRAQPPPQRQSAFLALWTAKEAAQKARGQGIWQGLPELRTGPVGSRWQARWPARAVEPLALQHRPLSGQLLALAFPEAWPDSLPGSVAAVETDPRGVPLRQASEQ